MRIIMYKIIYKTYFRTVNKISLRTHMGIHNLFTFRSIVKLRWYVLSKFFCSPVNNCDYLFLAISYFLFSF